MNAFVSDKPVNGVKASIYSINGLESGLREKERYSDAWRLCREFKGTAVPFMGGEKILLMGESESSIQCGNLMATFEKSVPLDMKDNAMRSAIENVIQQILNKRMRKLGYITERGTIIPRNFRRYNLDNGEPIQIHENGAQVHVEGLPSGHILVWIDPKVRVKQQVRDYILWKKESCRNSEIEQVMIGKKVFVEPFNQGGKITSLDWENTPETLTFTSPPDMKEKTGKGRITVKEFWKHKHYRDVDPDENPIVMVKLKGREISVAYPTSMVYLSTKGKSYPRNVRDTFTLPSISRVNKSEKMASIMLGEPFDVGDVKIQFSTRMATEDRLREIGKLVDTGAIMKPALLMGNNNTASYPKEIRVHGPFSGPRRIPVYYILPPRSKIDIQKLHASLQNFNSELKLGQLEKIGETVVQTSSNRPTRNDYWDVARTAGFEIDDYLKARSPDSPDDIKWGKPVMISILPDKDPETYAGGKQGAHAGDHSIQNMTQRTAIDIATKGAQYFAYNSLVQVYLKSLERGEAPWILQEPAGGAYSTAYLGYDVSRRREEESGTRKEAAATISMVDGQGRTLLNKLHTSQSGEVLDQLTANRMVFEVSGEAHRAFKERGEEFRRLVMFKDGIIRSNERENIKTGVVNAIEDMVPKATMPDDIEVELIGVVKSGIERMYKDNGYNPDDGDYAVFHDNTAVVATSNLGTRKSQVTVQTTRLEPLFRVSSTGTIEEKVTDINRLVKEYGDLCNLDWASLYRQPKYPIVLRLVQRLGEQYTMDISDPSYLPL